jgi:hypothetical protein
MAELDFHKATHAEERGVGYEMVLDVEPTDVPDEAAEYKTTLAGGGALIRVHKQGWIWTVREMERKEDWFELGAADTKKEAIEAGVRELDRRLARKALESKSKEIERKRR